MGVGALPCVGASTVLAMSICCLLLLVIRELDYCRSVDRVFGKRCALFSEACFFLQGVFERGCRVRPRYSSIGPCLLVLLFVVVSFG